MTRLFFKFRAFFTLAVIAVTAIAVYGLTQITLNDNLADIIKAENEEYRKLQSFFDEFGADDQECVLVLQANSPVGGEKPTTQPVNDSPQADGLFTQHNIRQMRKLAEAIDALPDISEVTSIFDIWLLVKRGRIRFRKPLIPEDDDLTDEKLAEAKQKASKHPLLSRQMVTPDGNTMLMAARLAGENLASSEIQPTIERLQELIKQCEADSDIRIGMTGVPHLRADIYSMVRRDQIIFTLIGMVAAISIAVMMFRRVTAVLIACVAPALGTLWTLGAMGLAGEEINAFNSILPSLVLVIGFTDSVHFIVDIRRSLGEGCSSQEATEAALRHLFLPCLLTSLTTAVGFGSLFVAEVDVIQRFGVACAGGAILNFLAVVTVVPLLASSRLGKYVVSEKELGGSRDKSAKTDGDLAPQGTSMEARTFRFLSRLVGWIAGRAWWVSGFGCALTITLFWLSLGLEPDNSINENVPDSKNSYQALKLCEEAFGGAIYTFVVVQWPDEVEFASREVLQSLLDVHGILDKPPELGTPFSIMNVLASTPHRKGDLASGIRYLEKAPPEALRKLLREDLNKAIVRIHTPDLGARRLKPVFQQIESQLDELRQKKYPNFKIHYTGSTVVATRNLNLMIVDLCKSLALAAGVIFTVITLAMRSIRTGLISILPNVFPLVAASSVLLLRGGALELPSVMMFSVCLGIAVDDTIHFISRFHSERRHTPDAATAVQNSVAKVGAALLVTTLTLLGGFSAGLFSELPAMRIFSMLACVALIAALIADVTVLPALLVCFAKKRKPSEDSE